MSDVLEQDQEDFYWRVLCDSFLSEAAVLLQRKGVTENDVNTALGVLNDRGGGKLGAVIIVLMPSLVPDGANTPSPYFTIKQTIQVIEMPLVNLGDTGVGISAESMAQHLRQLFQVFSNGKGGTYTFAGMDPLIVSAGQISYGVEFSRKAGDPNIPRPAIPTISADASISPATITMACATDGASIWYTTDGTYPASANPAAMKYLAPFVQASGATVRAAAQLTDYLQSSVRELTISQGASSAAAPIGTEGGVGGALGEGGENLIAEG